MIINLLLFTAISLLNAIFSFLTPATTLPTIGGFDIDSALVNGAGMMKTFFGTFWPFQVVMEGFLFLMGYYAIKMLLNLFLGSRTPGK